jgi:hypothetical protein
MGAARRPLADVARCLRPVRLCRKVRRSCLPALRSHHAQRRRKPRQDGHRRRARSFERSAGCLRRATKRTEVRRTSDRGSRSCGRAGHLERTFGGPKRTGRYLRSRRYRGPLSQKRRAATTNVTARRMLNELLQASPAEGCALCRFRRSRPSFRSCSQSA